MTVTTDRVDVSYSQYHLVDDNIPTTATPQQFNDCNGLMVVLDAGAIVLTGTDTGFITVGVSVLDSEPDFSLSGWEEAVDVSVHAPEGQLGVASLMGDAPSLPPLSAAGPGWYRVRCLARGRVSEFNTISMESTEEHLLQVWPAPAAPEKAHQVAFRFGEIPIESRGGRALSEPDLDAKRMCDRPNGR